MKIKIFLLILLGLGVITTKSCEEETDYQTCLNNEKCYWFSVTVNEKCTNVDPGCFLREKNACNDNVC